MFKALTLPLLAGFVFITPALAQGDDSPAPRTTQTQNSDLKSQHIKASPNAGVRRAGHGEVLRNRSRHMKHMQHIAHWKKPAAKPGTTQGQSKPATNSVTN